MAKSSKTQKARAVRQPTTRKPQLFAILERHKPFLEEDFEDWLELSRSAEDADIKRELVDKCTQILIKEFGITDEAVQKEIPEVRTCGREYANADCLPQRIRQYWSNKKHCRTVF